MQVDRRSSQLVVRSCEPIAVSVCREVGYNWTGMPNLAGHETQAEAELQIATFQPLVQYGCSTHLRFFLCAVYAPLCTVKVRQPIGPCRPLCDSVRRRCQPILQKFGYPWPPALDCSRFPPFNGEDHMCMPGPDEGGVEAGAPTDDMPPLPAQPSPPPPPPLPPPLPPHSPANTRHSCGQYRNPANYVYINKTNKCALLCDANDLFSESDKHFANIWMSIWAALCFLSTLFTVLTFTVDSQRFRYPERPIIVLSFCYNVCSIAYCVRLISGRESASCNLDGDTGARIVVQDGLQNTDCTLVFLLLDFFGTASAIWWVILTLTWFMAAGLKWGHEAIAYHSNYFHLVAWSLPAIKTVVILVTRSIDADELTGMCHVGNQDDRNLLVFVLLPAVFYLLLGTSFLLAGFVALFRIRKEVRNGGMKTGKLETLMVRIGIFSVLYTLPATCVVACYVYEYANRRHWATADGRRTPAMEVFMLKVFMSLVVGITSGMWVWSPKTILSWRDVLSGTCSSRTARRKRIEAVYPRAAVRVASPREARHKAVYPRTPARVANPRVARAAVAVKYTRNGETVDVRVSRTNSYLFIM